MTGFVFLWAMISQVFSYPHGSLFLFQKIADMRPKKNFTIQSKIQRLDSSGEPTGSTLTEKLSYDFSLKSFKSHIFMGDNEVYSLERAPRGLGCLFLETDGNTLANCLKASVDRKLILERDLVGREKGLDRIFLVTQQLPYQMWVDKDQLFPVRVLGSEVELKLGEYAANGTHFYPKQVDLFVSGQPSLRVSVDFVEIENKKKPTQSFKNGWTAQGEDLSGNERELVEQFTKYLR